MKYCINKELKELNLSRDESWEYFVKNKEPYINIFPKRIYLKVEYDLFTIDYRLQLSKSLLDYMSNYYDNYCINSKLPLKYLSFIGGEKNGLFTIYKKDTDLIINDLYNAIMNFVKNYSSIVEPKLDRSKYQRTSTKSLNLMIRSLLSVCKENIIAKEMMAEIRARVDNNEVENFGNDPK
jgi:hypothetical protein